MEDFFSFDRILGIVGVLIALSAFGVGVGMDTKTRGEYRFSVGCFIVSAALFAATITAWNVTIEVDMLKRIVISAILFSSLGVGTVESIRWVRSRHLRTIAETKTKSQITSSPAPVGSSSFTLQPSSPTASEIAEELAKHLPPLNNPQIKHQPQLLTEASTMVGNLKNLVSDGWIRTDKVQNKYQADLAKYRSSLGGRPEDQQYIGSHFQIKMQRENEIQMYKIERYKTEYQSDVVKTRLNLIEQLPGESEIYLQDIYNNPHSITELEMIQKDMQSLVEKYRLKLQAAPKPQS